MLNVSFCSKNSLGKVDTDHKLIFNAVVKYSLQMQQRFLKALWFLLLFQNWVYHNVIKFTQPQKVVVQ